MDTGAIIVFVVFGLIVFYLVDKNAKMIKYRRLYEDALKAKDRTKALEFGRLYHRYRTSGKAKATTSAELMISKDMKAVGINKFISIGFILITTTLLLFSCHKDKEPECVTWKVLYWQGTAAHVTVTTNYYPSNGTKQICGAGKDTVYSNKTVVLSSENSNLFNYMTFQGKLK